MLGKKTLSRVGLIPSKIDFYPTDLIVSARVFYGASPDESEQAERKLNDAAFFTRPVYEFVYNIDFGLSDDVVNLQKVLTTTHNKYYDLVNKHLVHNSLQIEHSYSIQAINLAWIALYNHITDKYYLYNDEIYSLFMNAEHLLSLAKDSVTETAFITGKKVINAGIRGGKAKGSSEQIQKRHAEWQKLANQMWDRNPHFSARCVALSIVKKTGGNSNTIRRIIKRQKK